MILLTYGVKVRTEIEQQALLGHILIAKNSQELTKAVEKAVEIIPEIPNAVLRADAMKRISECVEQNRRECNG